MELIERETIIKGLDGREYKVKIGTVEGGTIANPEPEPYCSVRLLPYQNLLFSADLEFLMAFKHLEDGDAEHEVPEVTIEQIKAWAVEQGYELQEY